MTAPQTDIVKELQELKIKDLHFTKFSRDLLSHLKEKQQKVLVKRFGLSGRKKVTLDAIGKEFGVTRERVRQIEAASLTKLRKLAKLDHNKGMFERIHAIVTLRGGAIHEDALVRDLISDLDHKRQEEIKKTLHFLLLLSEDVRAIQENDHAHPGWSLSTISDAMIVDIAKAYTEILEDRQEVLADEVLLEEIAKHKVVNKHEKHINPELLRSLIHLTRAIYSHDDGKRGLMHWPWVRPRTIRDKIFYVLTKKAEPMHFTEIAQAIEALPFDRKSVTVQTVHNELISDKRFVLVGRGLYGLSSWGFEPGTVEEVIYKVLEEGPTPMAQNEVVEQVLKRKKVKKATILINLQSSKKFKRTKEGYTLAEK